MGDVIPFKTRLSAKETERLLLRLQAEVEALEWVCYPIQEVFECLQNQERITDRLSEIEKRLVELENTQRKD